MKIKYIRRKHLISVFFCLILFLIGCHKETTHVSNNEEVDEYNGFILDEFAITNDTLIFYLEKVADNAVHTSDEQSEDNGFVLYFHKKNITRVIDLYHIEKQEIRDKFILDYNYRIIGYSNIRGIDFILLSNIDYKAEFADLFGEIVHPTGKNKEIEYIYYARNQYNNWPHFNSLFCPASIPFVYYNNQIIPAARLDKNFVY